MVLLNAQSPLINLAAPIPRREKLLLIICKTVVIALSPAVVIRLAFHVLRAGIAAHTLSEKPPLPIRDAAVHCRILGRRRCHLRTADYRSRAAKRANAVVDVSDSESVAPAATDKLVQVADALGVCSYRGSGVSREDAHIPIFIIAPAEMGTA